MLIGTLVIAMRTTKLPGFRVNPLRFIRLKVAGHGRGIIDTLLLILFIAIPQRVIHLDEKKAKTNT